MYVCMYVYIHVCMYIDEIDVYYIYIYICMYVYIYMCIIHDYIHTGYTYHVRIEGSLYGLLEKVEGIMQGPSQFD